ncbi:MAG: MFS transporter [Pseudomonadota bacterium]
MTRRFAIATVTVNQRYSWYVVLLLALLSIVSYADRLILGILVDPVKAELQISDTQMGFLLGLSFALVYATLALFLAGYADRHNRRNLIVAGVFVWSAMTSASAFANGFWQLAFCRLGVGLGEAALGPAALSMISDLFSKERRHTPISVFLAAGVVGGSSAFIIGGGVVMFVSQIPSIALPVIGELAPWRLVFLCMGVPGIVLGAFLLLTVREPERSSVAKDPSVKNASIGEVLRHIVSRRSQYLPTFGGILFVQMMVYAVATWYATVLIRNYELSIPNAGFAFGIIGLVFGTSGAILGPTIVSVLERNGRDDALLFVGVIAVAIATPATVFSPVAPTVAASLIAMAVVMFSLSAASALAPLLPQLIAPNAMRARVTATYFFVANSIGLGLTPVIVGIVNDTGVLGVSGIDQALALVAATLLPASLAILWIGRRTCLRLQQQKDIG